MASVISGRRRPVALWQQRELLVDGLIAIAVAMVQVGGTYVLAAHRGWDVSQAALALPAASGLSLAFRRRFPVWVLGSTYGLTLGYLSLERHGGAVWLSVIVAFGSAIVHGRRIPAIVFLALGYLGYLFGPVLAGKHRVPSPGFAVALGVGLAFLLGGAELARVRGQRALALAERREQEALRRAGEERLRVAREVHDVVAHNISVINVQAKTALHLIDREPERAQQALETITDISKQAMVELRSVLDVLRAVDDPAPRTPLPSLASLNQLLTPLRDSGLDVRLEERGQRPNLPANVDLAAYRIAQEALTNTARHSGASTAHVRLTYTQQELWVEVEDNGVGALGGSAEQLGHGILGMRERANALGGSLEAGPGAGGGFLVRARIPYAEAIA